MLWSLLALAVLVELGVPLVLLAARDRLIFFPDAHPTAAEGLAQLSDVDAALFEARRPDGLLLTGYDARPHGAPASPVVLYFHGNAGNVATRAAWLAEFVDRAGVRVVLASYAGYGGNAGRPSEAGLYADALAFHDALVASGVDPRQIVLYGESIGGAAALYVAGERPCAGVIVQATFSSLPSMARRAYPWLPLAPLLVRDAFPNAARAAELDVPLLIVQGTEDDVIPFAESERLQAAAPQAELRAIKGAGHNDLFAVGGRAYAEGVGRVVREWAAAVSD